MSNSNNISAGDQLVSRLLEVITEAALAKVDGTIKWMDNRISELERGTGDLKEKVEMLEAKLQDREAGLAGRVSDLEERIEDTVIGQDVRDLERRLDDLETMDEDRVSEIALDVNQSWWSNTNVTKALMQEDDLGKLTEHLVDGITSRQAEEIVRNGLNEIMNSNVKI